MFNFVVIIGLYKTDNKKENCYQRDNQEMDPDYPGPVLAFVFKKDRRRLYRVPADRRTGRVQHCG